MACLYFGFIILCGLFQYGSTIMCYECNSATNTLCLQARLPDNLKRNCSDHDRGVTHTLCRKIVQHVDYGVNGRLPESRVIRSCGWDETKFKGMCYHRAGYGGRQEVCSCTTDFCNAAATTTAATTLLTTTAILILGRYICE
ncbi:UPAR/Ly6 domain-containing protein crok-like [Anticarsia gemmatalis]|uniref:UPAR/Ly6 domain-containing protein crok-like n=1 Tax=Anticarsia gemmatalis TaxID=129554 RepID=UPI003F764375